MMNFSRHSDTRRAVGAERRDGGCGGGGDGGLVGGRNRGKRGGGGAEFGRVVKWETRLERRERASRWVSFAEVIRERISFSRRKARHKEDEGRCSGHNRG